MPSLRVAVSQQEPHYVVYEVNGIFIARPAPATRLPLKRGTDVKTVINDALASLTPGRTWLEKVTIRGNFTLSGAIKVPSYTILEIIGKLTLKEGVQENVIENEDPVAGNTMIYIVGGEIDGNKAKQTSDFSSDTQNGIYLRKCTKCFIFNVYIHDTVAHGLYLYDSSNDNEVSFCRVENIGLPEDDVYDGIAVALNSLRNRLVSNFCRNALAGIYITRGSYSIIEENVCKENRGTGIVITWSSYCVIKGNVSEGNTSRGIRVFRDSTYCIIEGNICRGNGDHGIYVHKFEGLSPDYAVISGNVCEGNGNAGIFAYIDLGSTIGLNQCKGNTTSGISLSECVYATIGKNECKENGGHGIDVVKSSHCSVGNNICQGNGSRGVRVYNLSNYNAIIGNVCEGNTDEGIYIYSGPDGASEHNIAEGNVCRNNNIGIRVYGSKWNVIKGNNCLGNTLSGIDIDGDLTEVNGNSTCRNGGHGIILVSPHCTISENLCEGNGGDGIRLADAIDNVVTSNRCTDTQPTKTQDYGIRETGTADYNVIIGNNLRGNLTGPLAVVGANTLYRTATDLDPLNIL